MKNITGEFAVRVGIVLTIAAVPALAETSITSCPLRITEPGNYVLNADLTCPAGGITILASNVSLKMNGHTITAVLTGITVGESTRELDHVGIQGPGLIISSSQAAPADGIMLQNAKYSQVSQVTIVGASIGIYVELCDFLTLTSNVIGHSGAGVAMFRTNSNSVTGNDTSGNTDGISLFLGSGNIISNNIASGNSNSGFNITGDARVYGNVTNGNGRYGIYVHPGSFQAFNNTSKANGLFDLFDEDGCQSEMWSDNVFWTANFTCPH
jgi:parallel beta-helix repeat protein